MYFFYISDILGTFLRRGQSLQEVTNLHGKNHGEI